MIVPDFFCSIYRVFFFSGVKISSHIGSSYSQSAFASTMFLLKQLFIKSQIYFGIFFHLFDRVLNLQAVMIPSRKPVHCHYIDFIFICQFLYRSTYYFVPDWKAAVRRFLFQLQNILPKISAVLLYLPLRVCNISPLF